MLSLKHKTDHDATTVRPLTLNRGASFLRACSGRFLDKSAPSVTALGIVHLLA